MNKYRVVLEYDGTAYHGWQLQKGLPTVQGSVEAALERLLGVPCRVHGAGRTDAGVHATGQVAHFLAGWSRSPEELRKAMNALLPADVMVRDARAASEDFHARHSAISKTYVYRILNAPLRHPLERYYTWHVPVPLSLPLMESASSHILGTHDFAAFGAPTEGTPSTVREISAARWTKPGSGEYLEFSIQGSGFLRYMVRSLVGTLVPVGKGKITPEQFSAILNSRDRSRAGPTAPPHGLVLREVTYGPDTMDGGAGRIIRGNNV